MADFGTRITIETERILIVARRQSQRAWCERCGGEVEFVPSQQARRVLDVAPEPPRPEHRTQFHVERARNGLAVCLKSLLRFLELPQKQ